MTNTLPAMGMAAITVAAPRVKASTSSQPRANQIRTGWTASLMTLASAMGTACAPNVRAASVAPNENRAAGPAAPARNSTKREAGPGTPMPEKASAQAAAMARKNGFATAPRRAFPNAEPKPALADADSTMAMERGMTITRSTIRTTENGTATRSPSATISSGSARKPRLPMLAAWAKSAAAARPSLRTVRARTNETA